MAHPLNIHVQNPHFDKSLDIYCLEKLGCRAIVSEYHQGEMICSGSSLCETKTLIVSGQVVIHINDTQQLFKESEWFSLCTNTDYRIEFTKPTTLVSLNFDAA